MDVILFIDKVSSEVSYIRSEPTESIDAYMSTYEEFMIILTNALLIVAVLNLYKNK